MFTMFIRGRAMRTRETPANTGPTTRHLYSWQVVTRPSRTILTASGTSLAALLPLTRALGQDTSRTQAADSLLARLRALESSVEVLQKQIAEQASSAVQSHS